MPNSPIRGVGALVDVALLAGRGEVRVGLLVLQQHAVAVQQDVRDEAAVVRQRDPPRPHRRRLRPRRDGEVQDVVRRLDVLGHIDVGDVERVGVLVEPVRGAVGGEVRLEGDAGHVEQVADGVLVLPARQAPDTGPSLAPGTRPLRGDERVFQRLQRR